MAYMVVQFKKLCQVETRRLVMLVGIMAVSVLVLQTLTLPSRNSLTYLFPRNSILVQEESSLHFSILSESKLTDSSIEVDKFSQVSNVWEELEDDSETKGKVLDLENDLETKNVWEVDRTELDNSESSTKKVSELNREEIIQAPGIGSTIETGRESEQGISAMNKTQIGSPISNISVVISNTTVKKLRCNMPPKSVMTISEMNSLQLRRRASVIKEKPQWSTILSSKPPNPALGFPFMKMARSYELMDRLLKVYVYRDGEKPIFHLPILKGLYAAEGWFMKLMEGNKKFIVKDPKKAHLYYMPFSTRMLEHSLYVPNSHNRTNLAAYLRNYTEMIAAKYSFWNRTGGADHFFVACHDWAPYETRHHMERCIKSMCNADVTQGFKIGKDVSLPETYVRSARNPLRDVGGEPPSNRSILAFFAGSMHGYLRPILLSHWENKDPDMKIFGRMPFGVASKMNYIRHMKTSKYCICAKGFEVNSPRVVEAIFYECVPVIISDNFVPPFFDVLNWDAFAVIVAEKDIPKLKEILLSISYEKYLAMQLAVKKVQRHFLWHSKPVKYDLFHMTLHSIWNSRVFMLKPK
ncbi:hypothetical protein IFM89_005475 [Coptis chinensis]|uniref:Exostosin GT47 domain-containing protein n=1 Tax=Coptis chinensis TaxID=261450 RepID=A0A835I913_9MAGN|nr:hypothetical protein IFM89_005475 [Coptis chinensis]